LFGASLFCLDFREHLDWFSLVLFFVVLLPAWRYICAAFWDWSVLGLFDFYLFCVASSEPTCFLFWIRAPELSTAMILQWPSCFASRFATTLGASDPAELNQPISSANASSIINCFLYSNGAPVPVSCLLFLLVGSLEQKRRVFAWFFFGFSFWGALSIFGFIVNVSWIFLC
jgi:hypothetical protein